MSFYCPDLAPIRRPWSRRDVVAGRRPAQVSRRSFALAGVAAMIGLCAAITALEASGSEAERQSAISALESSRPSRAIALGADGSVLLQARDQELQRARTARALIRRRAGSSGEPGDGSLPDPLSIRAIVLSLDAYSQALLHETVLLSAEARSPVPSGQRGFFEAIWSEEIDEILEVLTDRESLWKTPLPAEGGDLDLQNLLLSLCLPDAYKGDAYALARECFPLRSATLPESIAACCMDPALCREVGRGTDCAAYVAGIMAESIDQDAMVGFRYAQAYWSGPKDAAPRTPERDGRVAAATVRFLVELLVASEACGQEGPAREGGPGSSSKRPAEKLRMPGESAPLPAALEIIRSSGRLWPSWIDPFATVPGLRNPRWTEAGDLLCDVAIYEETFDALHARTRAWLTERLGPQRRTILVESR